MSKETIKVCIDGKKMTVPKKQYIKAKTKSLKEFGYTNLTEDETAKALEEAISGNAKSVISMFIESDLEK